MKTKNILFLILFILIIAFCIYSNLPKETMQIIELPARQLNAKGLF